MEKPGYFISNLVTKFAFWLYFYHVAVRLCFFICMRVFGCLYMQILFVDVTLKIKMGYLILPVGSINCCQRNLLFVTPILYQPNFLKTQVWNMMRNIKQFNSGLKKLAVSISNMTSLILLVNDRCSLWKSYQTNKCLPL